MTARAVIYARYSSDMQRAASIDDQVRLCKDRIAREGWVLAATYADRATSGSQLLRREYQRMLQGVREGAVDVVVAEALDRISRDQEHVAAFFKQLTFSGVRLITLAEGEINELHVGLKGTMNALFLTDLSQKTRRGLEGVVRKGLSAGGLSYGYDVVPPSSPDADRGLRAINACEAAVVCRIFSEYAEGKSPKAIVTQLNREGVAGPRGGPWRLPTLLGNRSRGTGILNNELYVGRLIWDRLKYIRDPDTGRRVSRRRPETDWTIVDVPDLRIVDQALWDRVKARQGAAVSRASRQVNGHRPWDRRRPRYLFSGLARCGVCGAKYIAINASQFGCSTAKNGGTCSNHHNIRRVDLEEHVLGGLRNHFMDPRLFREFVEEFERQTSDFDAKSRNDRQKLQAELDRLDRRQKKAVDAFLSDESLAEAMKSAIEEIKRERESIQQKLNLAEEPLPPLQVDVAEVYRASVDNLIGELADDEIRDRAIEIIRSLVECVALTPTPDGLEIEIAGRLAGILSLASSKKKPGGSLVALENKIKVVAGAGFEPTTFRL